MATISAVVAYRYYGEVGALAFTLVFVPDKKLP